MKQEFIQQFYKTFSLKLRRNYQRGCSKFMPDFQRDSSGENCSLNFNGIFKFQCRPHLEKYFCYSQRCIIHNQLRLLDRKNLNNVVDSTKPWRYSRLSQLQKIVFRLEFRPSDFFTFLKKVLEVFRRSRFSKFDQTSTSAIISRF